MLADDTELALDLTALESLRWFDKTLSSRIVAASASCDLDVIELLRLEATRQLAEFLFGLQARGIETADQIETLGHLHNDYLAELTRDKDKLARMGLREDRMLNAIFTGDVLPRLVQNWRDEPGAIDQSNLARFLATTMSTETCRKVAVACAEAGFLDRRKSVFGTMLVVSNGRLEVLFGTTLREFRVRLGTE
jgi:hypothetical protein